MAIQTKTTTASLKRRLLALMYDFLLLLGILFAISACAVAINRGEAVDHPIYYLSLIITTFVFFGWFWTHGGQTLGMRTWKIQIISDEGDDLTWKQAAIRFSLSTIVLLPTIIVITWALNGFAWYYITFALLGAAIGLKWLLMDANGLAWHDKLSACLLYTSPSPRDATLSRMPSSA